MAKTTIKFLVRPPDGEGLDIRAPKFYHFNQNNSGGYYVMDVDLGIGPDIIVEAHDADHAISRLEQIGEAYPGDFHQYCSCCGIRWSTYMEDDDGYKSPSKYGTPLTEYEAPYSDERIFVHYLNGMVECWDIRRTERKGEAKRLEL